MAFHEVRILDEVERGAVGGPQFLTDTTRLESGFEKRNQKWSQPLGGWDISYGITDAATLEAVIAFHYARRGSLHGFRFKDWSDFEIGDPDDAVNDFQEIGTGDNIETVFQVFKRYTDAGGTFDRTIQKLVSGRVVVLLDGVVQGAGFTIQENAGTITFSVAPGVGVLVQVACEFDVPVRFESDKLNVRAETFDAQSIPAINVLVDRQR